MKSRKIAEKQVALPSDMVYLLSATLRAQWALSLNRSTPDDTRRSTIIPSNIVTALLSSSLRILKLGACEGDARDDIELQLNNRERLLRSIPYKQYKVVCTEREPCLMVLCAANHCAPDG